MTSLILRKINGKRDLQASQSYPRNDKHLLNCIQHLNQLLCGLDFNCKDFFSFLTPCQIGVSCLDRGKLVVSGAVTNQHAK